jgi:hypothetical protein
MPVCSWAENYGGLASHSALAYSVFVVGGIDSVPKAKAYAIA